MLLAINILLLVFGADSWYTIMRRARPLTVLYLVLLCFGMYFGLPAEILCIERNIFACFYRWIGFLLMVHLILYIYFIFESPETMIMIRPS